MKSRKSRNERALRLAVIGAGSRGRAYSEYAEITQNQLEIIAVAENIKKRREIFSKRFNIPSSFQYKSGEELLKAAPEADAVLIATPDRTHVKMVKAFAEAGYNILLEKPIATDIEGVKEIADIVTHYNKQLFGVCHVLLYTPLTRQIKKIIENDVLGDIVSIQSLEPIGYWHFIHSYVRGNWRREDISSPLLLAKSCHDIDWIMHIMQEEVLSVSSFGSLNHFHEGSKPKNASNRCIDCSIEKTCPFSSCRFYRNQLINGSKEWPLDTVISEFTQDALEKDLKTGPYGKCVYSCDNTVVDNQVVNIKFANNKTASFSVVAFSDADYRKTRIFGSRGMLNTDGKTINVFSFLDNLWEEIPINMMDGVSAVKGHGGGDFELMKSYIAAWRSEDYLEMNKKTLEGCLSHQVVFAAEKSRNEECVVQMDEYQSLHGLP